MPAGSKAAASAKATTPPTPDTGHSLRWERLVASLARSRRTSKPRWRPSSFILSTGWSSCFRWSSSLSEVPSVTKLPRLVLQRTWPHSPPTNVNGEWSRWMRPRQPPQNGFWCVVKPCLGRSPWSCRRLHLLPQLLAFGFSEPTPTSAPAPCSSLTAPCCRQSPGQFHTSKLKGGRMLRLNALLDPHLLQCPQTEIEVEQGWTMLRLACLDHFLTVCDAQRLTGPLWEEAKKREKNTRPHKVGMPTLPSVSTPSHRLETDNGRRFLL